MKNVNQVNANGSKPTSIKQHRHTTTYTAIGNKPGALLTQSHMAKNSISLASSKDY